MTTRKDSIPARILDAAWQLALVSMYSTGLLVEYREVVSRVVSENGKNRTLSLR